MNDRLCCPGPANRRDLLRLGLLGGAAGLALPDLLRLQAASADASPKRVDLKVTAACQSCR